MAIASEAEDTASMLEEFEVVGCEGGTFLKRVRGKL